MAVRTFTSVHRQVLRDLRTADGTTPYRVPDAAGTGLVPVNFRFVGEATRTKNPEEARYPGWSVQIEAPRPNDDWGTVEKLRWFEPNPEDSSEDFVREADQPAHFWLDYRVAIYAKIQTQFDAMVAHLWNVWHVGRRQLAIDWPDDDDPSQRHRAQVRLRLLVNRFRPAENIFLADFLVTIPISVVLGPETLGPPIEEVVLSLGLSEDSEPAEEATTSLEP